MDRANGYPLEILQGRALVFREAGFRIIVEFTAKPALPAVGMIGWVIDPKVVFYNFGALILDGQMALSPNAPDYCQRDASKTLRARVQ